MKKISILFLFLGLPFLLLSQDELRITLPELVKMAQSETPLAELARTKHSNAVWQYKLFQAQFKPAIRMNGTLPDLNRSIMPITLPDGSEIFIPRSLSRTGVSLSLYQDVALTGGSVYVSSSLDRLDIFGSNGSVAYLSTPIQVGFNQPILAFNRLKWNKKIEPLRFEEAKRVLEEDHSALAVQATGHFFNLYISYINYESSANDKANADSLLYITKGRFEVGRIAETELLQVELNAMSAETDLAQAELDIQRYTEALRIFLGIQEEVEFNLEDPTILPEYKIDPEVAVTKAKENRSTVLRIQRQLLEADMEVERAKKNSGFQLNVSGSFGLSQTGTTFGGAFSSPLDQERLSLSIQVPLADWGKAEAQYQLAESQRQLASLNAEQEKINFEREVRLLVDQFERIRLQVDLSKRSLLISEKNYDMMQKRYRVGKVTINELNMAFSERLSKRQGYMQALRNFWQTHYELRRLTLYEF